MRLELRPVSKRAARAIARAVLGDAIPEEVVDRIADQAAGLPLFAEELARLTASGRDARHAPTIQAAIQVSLDALEGECRDAVGRLSVFGLTCWDAALDTLGMHGSEGVMKAVVAAEVLTEQNVSRFTSTREWLFKHALVRDVAYASLGERERKELHALAGAWLASMGEDSATVAGHYDLGGEHTRAADYWAKAAQRALATNALTDALSMAERALAFAEDKPTGFQRALCLDEAWSRLDPRASERETAISALEENVLRRRQRRARARRPRPLRRRARLRRLDQPTPGRGARSGRRAAACSTKRRARRRRWPCASRSPASSPTPRSRPSGCSRSATRKS